MNSKYVILFHFESNQGGKVALPSSNKGEQGWQGMYLDSKWNKINKCFSVSLNNVWMDRYRWKDLQLSVIQGGGLFSKSEAVIWAASYVHILEDK